ncbi:putative UDP-kanosamine synthase oxidoreductase subunit [subsurface metagenome]
MLQNEDLDSVIVATPTRFHYEIVMASLQKGLNVFCEKPFSLSPKEGIEMTREAEKRNLVNQVGYHNRFLGTFQEMKRLTAINLIGEIYHFSGEAYGPVVVKEKTGSWRAVRSDGGGCLYDYTSHLIDLIHFILRNTKKVRGTSLKSVYSKEVEDAVYSFIELDNGMDGQISVNWSDETYRKMSTSLTVWGTKGKMVCDATELKIYLKNKNDNEKLDKGWTTKYITDLTLPVDYNLRGEEYTAQIDHFFNRHIHPGDGQGKNSFSSAVATDLAIDLLLKDSKQL